MTAEGELASELGAAPGGVLLAERLLSLPSVVDSAACFAGLAGPYRRRSRALRVRHAGRSPLQSTCADSLAPALTGSGEATTCVVVFVCCRDTGRVCVAHYDTTCLQHPAPVEVVIEVCCVSVLKLSYKVQQYSKQKGFIVSTAAQQLLPKVAEVLPLQCSRLQPDQGKTYMHSEPWAGQEQGMNGKAELFLVGGFLDVDSGGGQFRPVMERRLSGGCFCAFHQHPAHLFCAAGVRGPPEHPDPRVARTAAGAVYDCCFWSCAARCTLPANSWNQIWPQASITDGRVLETFPLSY